MPQASVEYSSNVAELFDVHGFTQVLHAELVELTDTDLQSCKTRLIELNDVVIGDGSPNNAMVHVDIGIFSGRPPQQKTDLGKSVLAAAMSFLREWQGGNLQVTVAVNDLDIDNYHKIEIQNSKA
ncbi:5-carboxymethyl-2-hydroxymuconate Delta-isomerase [Sphingomonas xanthus]|uniref:5-carboxymethyl-2-hydroxymuconate isomerase n=1 Tax=Sphingomonas xanthus TaxID=2594473 RepID=A0A516INQ2_9SPHN|nr:5-carboxymethyl-2-hydroxymuconate isomerase [Sphingomonas xanthus]QDP18545.1 5-carboxymethyl-2-hydroxymuconate isomerase [Sphingomonas xanthus]